LEQGSGGIFENYKVIAIGTLVVLAIALTKCGCERLSVADGQALLSPTTTTPVERQALSERGPGCSRPFNSATQTGAMPVAYTINSESADGVPGRAPSAFVVRRMKVTAYCPCEKCCGRWADGYTASGHKIKAGEVFCAADPVLPFDTLISITGYNDGLPVAVIDRGKKIIGNRLDVYFPTHAEAEAWGVKWLECKIYE